MIRFALICSFICLWPLYSFAGEIYGQVYADCMATVKEHITADEIGNLEKDHCHCMADKTQKQFLGSKYTDVYQSYLDAGSYRELEKQVLDRTTNNFKRYQFWGVVKYSIQFCGADVVMKACIDKKIPKTICQCHKDASLRDISKNFKNISSEKILNANSLEEIEFDLQILKKYELPFDNIVNFCKVEFGNPENKKEKVF